MRTGPLTPYEIDRVRLPLSEAERLLMMIGEVRRLREEAVARKARQLSEGFAPTAETDSKETGDTS